MSDHNGSKPGLSYAEAGVDVERGDELVERIKPWAKKTRIPEMLSGVGGFAGLCALPSGLQDPILVSGTDGVGTKLKLAFATGIHDTIGIDLVAMCVNDVITCGARPLFFLDYFATGKLEIDVAEKVIAGIAEGCMQAGCALLGGETAELPGMYHQDEYDLAGFSVGVVERAKMLDGTKAKPGDVVLGVASSGLHSNGYSLARKALLERGKLSLGDHIPELDTTLGRALLAPTRIYAKAVAALLATCSPKAIAHITGGGIEGNLPRVLPVGTKAVLNRSSFSRSPLFDLIQVHGDVAEDEMYRTFNMGLGLCVVVSKEEAKAAIAALESASEKVWTIGTIESDDQPESHVEFA